MKIRLKVQVVALFFWCSSALHATETITYIYDDQGRLVSQSSAGSVNNAQSVVMTLDAADNRANLTVSGVALPSLSIASDAKAEGGILNFVVTLTPAAVSTVTVNYATLAGTAIANLDYTPKSGTLTYTVGQSTKTIDVATIHDTDVEPNEIMTVNLTSPSGAMIADGTGVGTIINND